MRESFFDETGMPRYNFRQRKLSEHVRNDKFYAQCPCVNPFSDEELRELMQDVDHYLRVMLFAHYWEEDSKLSWEEFLVLTQGREDIAKTADIVLYLFPFHFRPDLDVFDHMIRGSLQNYDYADRNDLFPADCPTPLPMVPERSLRYAVDSVIRRLESCIYVKRKGTYERSWKEYMEALETQPLLSQALLQRTRETFSANMEKFKELWGTDWINTPPLRLP